MLYVVHVVASNDVFERFVYLSLSFSPLKFWSITGNCRWVVSRWVVSRSSFSLEYVLSWNLVCCRVDLVKSLLKRRHTSMLHVLHRRHTMLHVIHSMLHVIHSMSSFRCFDLSLSLSLSFLLSLSPAKLYCFLDRQVVNRRIISFFFRHGWSKHVSVAWFLEEIWNEGRGSSIAWRKRCRRLTQWLGVQAPDVSATARNLQVQEAEPFWSRLVSESPYLSIIYLSIDYLSI